jgi:uncharacterized protein YegJ (DUF2314 family)
MRTKLADVALGFVSLLLLAQVFSFAYDHITSGESRTPLWQQLGATFALATGALLLWRASSPPPAAEPLKSLVLLLRTPRALTVGQLRQAIVSSLGVLCEQNDKTASNFVTDTPPAFLIRADGYTFLVNNCESVYIKESQNTPGNIPNVRLQQIIRDHRAWLSVDLLEAPENATSDLVYQRLGRLIAALADKDCVGVFCPETSQLNVWHSSLLVHLRGTSPLQAVAELADVPAVRVTANDTELQEASHTATSMWSVFVNAFEQRRPDQTFAIKAPFTDGHETEYMWLIVTEIGEEAVIGSLDNEPVYLRNVSAGDAVTIPVDQVNDWLYTDGDEMVGGFTTEALTKSVAA